MEQAFLLSAKAVTLGLFEIANMSEPDAYALFKAVRFADNGGVPYCPTEACDRAPCYEYANGKHFKCKACEKKFTVTSQTVFASHKLSFKQIMITIKLFVDGVNGSSALKMRRHLGVSYKAAFVLLHKLREAMAELQNDRLLTGTIEVDGVYIGGHKRKPNMKINAPTDEEDGRKWNDKRRSIVTLKERRQGGRSRSFVLQGEKDAVPIMMRLIHPSADLITDEGSPWKKLIWSFNSHETVNHTLGHMINGIHINGVESFHSRVRRGERGIYVSINKTHAQNYVDEFSWREDNRRVSNGQQFNDVFGCVARMRKSTKWTGYWNKRKRALAPEGQFA